MDYSYYSGISPYGFHSLPMPDQNRSLPKDSPEDIYPSLNNHNSLDPSLQLDPTSFVHSTHSPSPSNSSNEIAKNAANPVPMGGGADGQPATEQTPRRSSSEEKDGLLPPKNRRKEQNRAAQRAFRERRERRVRELEDKVICLEKNSTSLQADNERLKQELAKSATENEVLRATSSFPPRTPSSSSSSPHRNSEEQPMTAAPMKFTPIDFLSRLVPNGQSRGTHRVMVCGVTGDRLLDAHATWDFIQAHELFKLGMVDIADVSARLKQKAQCNGQGPAFSEREVRKAIEESAARRSDELI